MRRTDSCITLRTGWCSLAQPLGLGLRPSIEGISSWKSTPDSSCKRMIFSEEGRGAARCCAADSQGRRSPGTGRIAFARVSRRAFRIRGPTGALWKGVGPPEAPSTPFFLCCCLAPVFCHRPAHVVRVRDFSQCPHCSSMFYTRVFNHFPLTPPSASGVYPNGRIEDVLQDRRWWRVHARELTDKGDSGLVLSATFDIPGPSAVLCRLPTCHILTTGQDAVAPPNDDGNRSTRH